MASNSESSVPELPELIVIVIVIPSSLPPGSTAPPPPPPPTLVMSSLLYPPLVGTEVLGRWWPLGNAGECPSSLDPFPSRIRPLGNPIVKQPFVTGHFSTVVEWENRLSFVQLPCRWHLWAAHARIRGSGVGSRGMIKVRPGA